MSGTTEVGTSTPSSTIQEDCSTGRLRGVPPGGVRATASASVSAVTEG